MRFIQILFISFSIICSTASQADNNCLIDKYIFDIGSGGISIMGYEVNICKNIIHKTLASKYYTFSLQQCISSSHDGKTIPNKCIADAQNAIVALKKELDIDCKQQKCSAVATAWARNAKNADILIDKIKDQGVKVTVISQQTEGELAFKSFITTNQISHEQEKNLAVFDLGGGSFQLSNMDDKSVYVYYGSYGMFNFKSLILSKFGNDNGLISPEALEKVKDFSLKEVWGAISKDKRLTQKLKTPGLKVYGVGSFFGKGVKNQLALGDSISLEEVNTTIKNIIGKSADDIHKLYPTMPKEVAVGAQFSLLIIYSVMEGAGINTLQIADNDQFHEYISLNGI